MKIQPIHVKFLGANLPFVDHPGLKNEPACRKEISHQLKLPYLARQELKWWDCGVAADQNPKLDSRAAAPPLLVDGSLGDIGHEFIRRSLLQPCEVALSTRSRFRLGL